MVKLRIWFWRLNKKRKTSTVSRRGFFFFYLKYPWRLCWGSVLFTHTSAFITSDTWPVQLLRSHFLQWNSYNSSQRSGIFYPRTSQKNINNGQCCLRIAQSRSANATVQQWKASECPIYLQKRETWKIQIFYGVAQQSLLLYIITHWPQAAWWCWGSWTASVEPTWRPLSSAGLGYFAHWSPAGSSDEQVDGGICNSLLYSGPEQGR